MFRESGIRYRRGLLIEQLDPAKPEWTVCNKQNLLYCLYVEHGAELKFSEIERELFPAILAWFDQAGEAS